MYTARHFQCKVKSVQFNISTWVIDRVQWPTNFPHSANSDIFFPLSLSFRFKWGQITPANGWETSWDRTFSWTWIARKNNSVSWVIDEPKRCIKCDPDLFLLVKVSMSTLGTLLEELNFLSWWKDTSFFSLFTWICLSKSTWNDYCYY